MIGLKPKTRETGALGDTRYRLVRKRFAGLHDLIYSISALHILRLEGAKPLRSKWFI